MRSLFCSAIKWITRKRDKRMEEMLTLVDENDNEIGLETREKCHFGKGKMHRAIVVFLFNKDGLLLIQQRSDKEKLWPRYWDCSVATHVYPNETYEGAAKRGLIHELGITATVKKVLAFTYFALFGKHSENEYCALLVGKYDGKIAPNVSKVSNYDHVSLEDLQMKIKRGNKHYTPWLKIALEKFLSHPSSGLL